MAVNLPPDPLSSRFSSLGDVVFQALKYVYVFAGLSMLIMLLYGGITLMTAAGDPGKSKVGYGMIRNALIGFLAIFLTYFIAQIVQVALGVKFL